MILGALAFIVFTRDVFACFLTDEGSSRKKLATPHDFSIKSL
jgi:hypothetical protein